jgi:hypothetical protein
MNLAVDFIVSSRKRDEILAALAEAFDQVLLLRKLFAQSMWEVLHGALCSMGGDLTKR